MLEPTIAPLGPDPELVSLVIPVLNERESLPPLHAEIAEVAAANHLRVEVVFVDDGSTDGSWEVIADLAAAHAEVRGIRFRRNFGKAAALAAGFQRRRGETVITLDADLQDDPHEIPRFLDASDERVRRGQRLEEGAATTRGTRSCRAASSTGWSAASTGVQLHDHNCGMKAYRAEVFREVRLYGELHRFIPVLADARGLPGRRNGHQPPAAEVRPLEVRRPPLRQGLPRPAHGASS